MNFGQLIDATNAARRDTAVQVRAADGRVWDIAEISVEFEDLDAGKAVADVVSGAVPAEGASRETATVWLTLAS